jgi:hypothetical protein
VPGERHRSIFLRLGEEGQNPSLGVDHHRHLPVQLTVAQAAFDFLRLDPEAANFHLIITPSAQLDPSGVHFAMSPVR